MKDISLTDNTDKLIELQLASIRFHSLEDDRDISVSQEASWLDVQKSNNILDLNKSLLVTIHLWTTQTLPLQLNLAESMNYLLFPVSLRLLVALS